jgi:hypothetical protein
MQRTIDAGEIPSAVTVVIDSTGKHHLDTVGIADDLLSHVGTAAASGDQLSKTQGDRRSRALSAVLRRDQARSPAARQWRSILNRTGLFPLCAHAA